MNNSAEALAQLQQAQQGAQNPAQFLTNQQNQLGVGGQRDTVTGLRTSLDNTTKLLKQVAPSVMGRTQGSLVTNAQATRQIGNEQAPIAQNLADQGTIYNRANADLTDSENRASQLAGAEYTGQQDRIGYLQNIFNTLYQKERDAESDRQFNASLTKSGASAGGGGGYDLSSILGALGGGNTGAGFNSGKDSGGGTKFTYQGKPVTAAQFFEGTGGSLADFLSRDKNSQQAAKDYTSGNFTYDQLVKKYSNVFGGV